MTIYKFIEQEFKLLAKTEISEQFSKALSEELITEVSAISLIDEEELDSTEMTTLFETRSELTKLTITFFILDQINKASEREYSETDLRRIEKKIAQYPKNNILPILWVFQKIDYFEEEECFDAELVDFYKTVFDKYAYLMDIDDFFEETDLLISFLTYSRLEKSFDVYYPVFKKAAKKYPKHIEILKEYGIILYFKEDYIQSLTCFKTIKDITEEEKQTQEAYRYLEELDALQFMAMNYNRLGEYEKLSSCVDFVLSSLPRFDWVDLDGNSGTDYDTMSYIDSFLLRMKLSLKKNDSVKFMEDYKKINGDLEWYNWAADYPEVFEYLNKLETKQ